MEMLHIKNLVAAIVYSGLGIVILFIAFWIIEKITPENLWKEILVNKNNALAILAGCFILAIAIIIASAIH